MVSHFTNIKVRGIHDQNNVKNYMITNTDDGSSHMALRRSNGKYDLGKNTDITLRQCKQLVSEDRVEYFADGMSRSVSPEVSDDLAAALFERPDKTWDCVDPCALLIIMDCKGEEVDRTLDAYGWINPDGTRDDEAANEAFEKWSKK